LPGAASGARAIACPASLKGVLGAFAAAEALAEGLERGGLAADRVPVADGGEGTLEVLFSALGGDWRTARVSDPLGRVVEARWLGLPDGTAAVESAQVLGLPLLQGDELDPLRATSRGLGELLLAALAESPRELLIALGGVATVDGGAGLREVVDALPVPARVACDVRAPLLGPRGAARVFGPQKGAGPAEVEELEARLAAIEELRAYAGLPGAGAAGGLGAALAALGARLEPGAELVLEAIGFDERLRGAELAVTGEGTLDATTLEGKAPAAVAAACRRVGVRCAVFGGRVDLPSNTLLLGEKENGPGRSIPVAQPSGARCADAEAASNTLLLGEGVEVYALSGDPGRAREDLVELGERLARLHLAHLAGE
jgi:glycerate kinase